MLVLLAGALYVSALTLGAMAIWSDRRRSARTVERPYVLEREDAIRFDEIITGILADDPGFATRCGEHFERGE